MKKLLPFLIALMSMLVMQQTASALVYTAEVPAGTFECYIAGNFPTPMNWTPSAAGAKMTKVDATHFIIDLPLADATMEYKYCSGPEWTFVENDAAGKEISNRSYGAGVTDVVIKWAMVYNPTVVALPKKVTINALVSDLVQVLYLAGSFNKWVGPLDSTKMVRGTAADGVVVFTKTLSVPDANTLQFNFCAGPGWDYAQKNPSGNFTYPAADVATSVQVISFKKIYDQAAAGTVNITATVPVGTQKIWIVGSFALPNWSFSTAIEGIRNLDGSFSFVVPNVISFSYVCVNKLDWASKEMDPVDPTKQHGDRSAAYSSDANTTITVSAWKEGSIYTTPTIVSASSISNLNYNKGNGPSVEQSFPISGFVLSSNITVTPPVNFQISKTSGIGFTNLPITLIQSAGTVDANIYVRLKAGISVGNYEGNIELTSTGATSLNVSCTGTVAGPTINSSVTSITALNYDKGNGPSIEKLLSINGVGLDDNIVITPSSNNLQLSKTSGASFSSTPITLTQTIGNVATTTIYVRLKAGLNFADYTENLAITSTNALTKNIICTGTVAGPTIKTITTTLTGFTYARGAGPSSSKNFSVSGVLLEANLVVTPSTNYEISTNNSIFASTPISLIPSSGTVLNTTIYVRLKAGLIASAYNENISLTSTNAVTKTIACTGTVLGPNIVASTTSLTNFNYDTDSGPSDQQSFIVSGADLTANILITTNPNFQISTVSGGSFSTNAITLTQSAGIVNNTTIYVRLKAGLVDANYTSNVTITSTNADVKTVACSGTVGVGVAPTNYSISVSVGTNGIVKENSVTLADGSNISVVSGATKTFTITPNAGYEVATLTYNGVNVKSQITNNQYTTAAVLAAGTLNVTFQKVTYRLSIKSAETGTANLLCEYGATPALDFTAAAGWKVNTVFYNNVDVTSSLVNGVYTVGAITANALLNVSFVTDAPSGMPEVINSKVRVFTTTSDIIVEGATKGETITLFTVNGKQLQTIKSDGKRTVIPAQQDAVYLVKTANKTFKVIL